MPHRIKLENIVSKGYDRQSGKAIIIETSEYVCGGCRHLVELDDVYCWRCGEVLEQSNIIEHHSQGQQLTDAEFHERRKLCHK